jgi:8-oxo-dGTP pyrophosphatase MutT (NUDIX family)
MTRPSFDPHAMPVVSAGAGNPISEALLSPESLRRVFRAPAPWQPEVTGDTRLQLTRESTPAAVLVPLMLRPRGLTVLLTQRTLHLTDHGGQISFPGGRVEDCDASRVETALRETREEVGLDASRVEVIGQLPEYRTITGYAVTPVIGLVMPPTDEEWQLDKFEVAHILEPPLAFFMNPANHERRQIDWREGDEVLSRHFYSMPWVEGEARHFVWGATAAMIRNLYSFLAVQSL